MGLKVYRARTMADALAEVKRDLGKDAVILHTKSFRSGSVLGLGGKPIVEVTASNDPSIVGRGPRRRRDTAAGRSSPVIASNAGTAAGIIARNAYAGSELRPESERDALSERRVQSDLGALAAAGASATTHVSDVLSGATDDGQPAQDHGIDDAPGRPHAEPADVADGSDPFAGLMMPPAAPETKHQREADDRDALLGTSDSRRHRDEDDRDEVVEQLRGDLHSIKQMVARVLSSPNRVGGFAGASIAGSGDALFEEYLRLTENAVASELAEDIAGRVRDELTPSELGDSRVVHQSVLRQLASMISVDPDASTPRANAAGPRVIALIGPTGVGKTTTVAKLAATYKLRHGVDVGLVTSDTYRIAAVEQLRTYAEIIGVPLKVVTTPSDMASAVSSLADKDVLLIDTAGRSPRDASRLDELQDLLDSAQPDETHLVLSGASSEGVLMQAADRFGALSPNRVIFTKLDEAVNFGVLVGVASRVKLKLSYVTTGQEVPDHIEAGCSNRLARMILEGEGALV